MFSQMLYTTIIISSLPAGMVKNHVDWKFLSVSHVSVTALIVHWGQSLC